MRHKGRNGSLRIIKSLDMGNEALVLTAKTKPGGVSLCQWDKVVSRGRSWKVLLISRHLNRVL
jgi:hypothetical protein